MRPIQTQRLTPRNLASPAIRSDLWKERNKALRLVEGTTDPIEWLRTFETQHSRRLRVLHVGNIANNAYLNAKFLRSVGVEAHVVSYDYQHVMATPEWEEIELLHGHGDDFLPRFSKRDLRGYRRPSWFVSGPLPACASQIAMLWGEHPSRLRAGALFLLKQLITLTARLFGPRAGYAIKLLSTQPRHVHYKFRRYLGFRLFRSWAGRRVHVLLIAPLPFLYRLCRYLGLRLFGPRAGRRVHVLLIEPLRFLYRLSRFIGLRLRAYSRARRALNFLSARDLSQLITQYNDAFPQRPDRLKVEDIVPYQFVVGHFRDMFRHYDIIQCYATEPIHALLSGKRPYVAFEHGTLRHFTMGNDSLHRLTALAYREADHTFITNGDCLAYAKRLGIENYSPIIHPVDIAQHRQNFGDAIDKLRREAEADVILFCPTRHDWDIKGTDQFIRALPLVKHRVSRRVKMVLVEWGRQVEESKKLLEDLGCTENAIWKPSMCRITMIKHIRAADVVLDQMVLPVFGSTAPQTIAAGKPVIGSYVPQETQWLIPEPAPILSAFSPEEIADAVVQALDPDWLADYEKRARYWSDTYHHPDVVIKEHLRTYRNILGDTQAGGEAHKAP